MDDGSPKLLAADEPHPVIVARPTVRRRSFSPATMPAALIPRSLGTLGLPGKRARPPYRLGYRHLGTSRFARRRARCRPHRSGLFAPGHRLQPRPRRADLDRRDQRAHRDSRQSGDRFRRSAPPRRRRSSGPTTAALPRRSTGGRRGANDHAGLDAQLHAGVQERRPAVACRRALQSRPELCAHRARPACEREGDLVVGDNEPYRVSDTPTTPYPSMASAAACPMWSWRSVRT